MSAPTGKEQALFRAVVWSFAIGVLMLGLKVGGYWITGSTAILSDAAESVVHVLAVAFVVFSVRLSQKPADESHLYGHAKIGFFSAGFEGGAIALAGAFILWEAASEWIAGPRLRNIGPGAGLVALALAVNGVLGWRLVALGKKNNSLILVANGRHVLADAWTSAGVLVGLFLVWATGLGFWDPLCALAVAAHILWQGFALVRRSAAGLMDAADPAVDKALRAALARATARRGVSYHRLRHRNLGDGHWVDLHLIFDDETTVRDAHRAATEIEREVRAALGESTLVTTHLEPARDHGRIHGHSAAPE